MTRSVKSFLPENIDDAIKDLQSAVTQGQFSLKLRYGEGDANEKEFKVSKLAVTTLEERDKDMDRNFKAVKINKRLNTGQQSARQIAEQMLSVGDCYTACRDEPSLNCLSFSFCPNTENNCILSSENVLNVPDDSEVVTDANGCTVYQRKMLNRFYKEDGTVLQLAPGKVAEGVENNEDCAIMCNNDPDNCQSFEYCGDKKCIIRTEHYIELNKTDAPGNNGGTKCEFYTSKSACIEIMRMLHSLRRLVKYIEQFSLTGPNLVVNVPPLQRIEGLTVVECANYCGTNSDCKSINYCPPTNEGQSICALMTASALDPSATTEYKALCVNYGRST